MQIRKAVKGRQKLRIGLVGPTGSGKTMTALKLAEGLVSGTDLRIGAIDTERESMELYADLFDFDVIPLTESHDPRQYIEALEAFASAGNYGAVVIDSASHAWMGKDGIQEQLDKYAKKNRGDSFGGWREMTPVHNRFVDAMLAAPFHLIVTLRAKMEYVVEQVERNGRTVNQPRKVGMAPVQRDGMEYEFTVVCDMDTDHNLIVGKTRCNAVDGMVVNKPDAKFAKILRDWIEDGADKPSVADEKAALRQRVSDLTAVFVDPEVKLTKEQESAIRAARSLATDPQAEMKRLEAAAEFLVSMRKNLGLPESVAEQPSLLGV